LQLQIIKELLCHSLALKWPFQMLHISITYFYVCPASFDLLSDPVQHRDALNNQQQTPGSNKRRTVGAESF